MTYFCLSMDFIRIFQILGESSWENVFPQSSLFTHSLSVPALPCLLLSCVLSLSLRNICCCALVPNEAETRPKPKRAEAVFINWRPPESQMQQRARHVRAVVFSAEIVSLRFGKLTE